MRHFQEKETKATATKTERSGTITAQTERKKKKNRPDIPSKKSNLFDKNSPPFGEHNLQKQKTTNPDQQTGKKKEKEKKRKHV